MLTWREITSTSDPLLESLIQIYEASFPIEVLAPPSALLSAFANRDEVPSSDVMHIGAVVQNDAVLGGAVFGFLSRSCVGFISYVFVAASMRGRGVGKFIYDVIVTTVTRDAMAVCGRQLEGLLFEVERIELAKEASDKDERRRRVDFFGKMGATILEGLDYLQPPLHSGETAVPMYLMFHPIAVSSADLSASKVLSWIDDIYRRVYVAGSGLLDRRVAVCRTQVAKSMKGKSIHMRRPSIDPSSE